MPTATATRPQSVSSAASSAAASFASSASSDQAELARRQWDVLVVGAGPAGSIAARQLARSGATVLLVDKARFPRRKVCGCCIGAAAVSILEQIGLGDLLPALGARPIRQFQLAAQGRTVPLALDGGVSVSRDALDAALVRAAVAAGAHFMSGSAARLIGAAGSERHVELTTSAGRITVTAGAVVAADGIYGGFLARQTDCRRKPAANSRIGRWGGARRSSRFLSAWNDLHGDRPRRLRRSGSPGRWPIERGSGIRQTGRRRRRPTRRCR